jgi:hypothetical protein
MNIAQIKGVNNMPGRDTTGPQGQGSTIGRGLGNCNTAQRKGQNSRGNGCRGQNQGNGRRRRTMGEDLDSEQSNKESK